MDMKIWHRVGFNADVKPDFKKTIDDLKIEYEVSPLPGHVVGMVYFDIAESDPHWKRIAELVKIKGASDILNTAFTPEEILAAEWSRLIPGFEMGYPQPKKDMGWKHFTYENQCPQCGVGYRQKGPFRLANEPRLGKRDFVCLYWTYTIFCTFRVLEALQERQIRGYKVCEAIIHKTNRPSEVVSQLVFPNVAAPGLVDEDKLEPETCSLCGITKYAYYKRGYMHFKREALQPDTDFLLTHEWFGSGGYGGYRDILVSNRVACLILNKGWRGVALKPIKVI